MRIAFFGAYDDSYPRNRILREGLAGRGWQVVPIRARETRAWRRYPALAMAFGRAGLDADVVFVPEFRHKDMPLARWLAGRRPVVFDPLVSRHDTLVGDWRLHGEASAQARWNLGLDRLSLRLADRVICDTWAHGALYESLGVPRSRLRRVLVGAERVFFEVAPIVPAEEVRIVYLGGFLPLHGTRVIVDALAALERRSGLPPWRACLAGRGIEWNDVVERARVAGLKRAAFPGEVPYAAAPRVYEQADIVLGAFGGGAKTGRVVPHKLYQGLASGRAVVTGDGEGLREVFVPDLHLLAVRRADPLALADALERLLRDHALRARLGAAGRARALEIATPEAIGATLDLALAGLGAAA